MYARCEKSVNGINHSDRTSNICIHIYYYADNIILNFSSAVRSAVIIQQAAEFNNNNILYANSARMHLGSIIL